MAQIFPRWTNRIPRLAAAGGPALAVAVVLGVWYWFSPRYTDVGYQPAQPVPFSHKLHAGDLGLDCRYCHTTVERAALAAVPATQTCMNCHTLVLPESPKLAPVRASFESGAPIPWRRVHMLPDYAYFDHSVHLAAGVGCVSCHGRVDQMNTVNQVEPLSMSWCLDCHRDPSASLRPLDQVTNMKWHADYDPSSDPQRIRPVNPPVHCSGCHR